MILFEVVVQLHFSHVCCKILPAMLLHRGILIFLYTLQDVILIIARFIVNEDPGIPDLRLTEKGDEQTYT